MTIDDLALDGHPRTQVGVIAHEIGHAWGLQHEHQRPDFWSQARYGGTGEQLIEFNCNNLHDYDEMVSVHGQDRTDNVFCISQIASSEAETATPGETGFSASQYLPIVDRSKTEYPSSGTEIDWDSIMMYSGDASGKKLPNGMGAVVMSKVGDPLTLLPNNISPSPKDIANLLFMYRKLGECQAHSSPNDFTDTVGL